MLPWRCFFGRLAFLVVHVWSRSLPDKNELANACLGAGHLSLRTLWDIFTLQNSTDSLLIGWYWLQVLLHLQSWVCHLWYHFGTWSCSKRDGGGWGRADLPGMSCHDAINRFPRFSLRPVDAIKIFVWPGQTSNDWYSSTTWKETPDFGNFMTKWSKKGLHLHSEFLTR